MQQPQQIVPIMPSFPAANITTEQIQKYLDDNKKLILAILDNQNLGKLAECAQYQAQLQRNLMYLAAIADAQPQAPTMPQMALHPAMQQGQYYLQPQAGAISQQTDLFPQKMSFQSNNPLHMHGSMLLQQQAFQGQLGMGSMESANNWMQTSNTEGTIAGHAPSIKAVSKDGRGSKHDIAEAVNAGIDGHGNSGSNANGEWK